MNIGDPSLVSPGCCRDARLRYAVLVLEYGLMCPAELHVGSSRSVQPVRDSSDQSESRGMEHALG